MSLFRNHRESERERESERGEREAMVFYSKLFITFEVVCTLWDANLKLLNGYCQYLFVKEAKYWQRHWCTFALSM